MKKNLLTPTLFMGSQNTLATKYLLSLHKKNNFPVTILRLYQAYGPGQDTNRLIPFIIKSCLKIKNSLFIGKNNQRKFVHVNDIVRSILKCFKNNRAKGNIINIGTAI